MSDPRDPVVLQSLTTTLPAPGILTHPAVIGDDLFGVSGGVVDGNPTVVLIDASDPADLKTSLIKMPTGVNDLVGMDGILYTTSSDGFTLFDLGSVKSGSAVVEVRIPAGVSVVPGSFNIEPTQTIPGAEFDSLVWDGLSLNSSLTWETTANLNPGDVKEVVQQARVDFTLPSGETGQIPLPPLVVVGDQPLTLTPDRLTVRPGESAAYTISVKNPLASEATYNLSVQGVPQGWVDLDPTVIIPAGGTIHVGLTLQSDVSAPTGETGFVVSALDSCATGSAHGALILDGEPISPPPAPLDVGADVESVARGCALDLTPGEAAAGQGTPASFGVRVTNTGNAPDTVSLSVDLPAGFTGGFDQTVVELLPGLGNFRDVPLLITPPRGASGIEQFTVTARINGSQCDQAAGNVSVASQGVDLSVSPPGGVPGSTFQLAVTNTGLAEDTFDLALAGPLAPFASLSLETVTLGSNDSRNITITLDAIDFAFPGTFPLTAVAVSQANTAVQDQETAAVTIAATRGVHAEFDPSAIQLLGPGTAASLLVVGNTGNTEDVYTAAITGTSGPISASLDGLDGQPTQVVPLFRLPGTSTGAILLSTILSGEGQGVVTVTVNSLADSGVADTATAVVRTDCLFCNAPLDHFLCYKTRPTRASICAEDAPVNAGGSCETEAECGGDEEETSFCLPNRFPRGLEVALADLFEDKDFEVKKPLGLCTPADKNSEGINDELTHLQSYRTREVRWSCADDATQNPLGACTTEEECGGATGVTSLCQRTPRHHRWANVRVDNQFGTLFVDTKKPDQMLVPTAKGLDTPVEPPDPLTHEVDHFKCYKVKVRSKVCEDDPGVKCRSDIDCADAGLGGSCNLGFPEGVRVTVQDQLITSPQWIDVKRPDRLCDSVDKNGEGIKNPDEHLMCYQVKLVKRVCAQGAPANEGEECKGDTDCGGTRGQTAFCLSQPKHERVRAIHVNNQYGPEMLDTIKEEELCVPSTITLQ